MADVLFIVSHLRLVELPLPVYQVSEEEVVSGLCEGVLLDVYFPGFPSLKHNPHSAHLEKRGVRVFQSSSRDENVILTLQQQDEAQFAVSCERIYTVVYVLAPMFVC